MRFDVGTRMFCGSGSEHTFWKGFTLFLLFLGLFTLLLFLFLIFFLCCQSMVRRVGVLEIA